MFQTLKIASAAAGLSALTLLPTCALAEPRARQINLIAEAHVNAAPDMATVSTGVTSEGKTAQEAMQRQAAAMSGIIEQLKKAGVAEKHIQTSSFSLSPIYYNRNSMPKDVQGNRIRIKSYEARNTVTVVMKDLNKVGKTLDALVSAGATNINNILFQNSNEAELLDQARIKAAKQVKQRAQLYAQALGLKLGPLTNLSEHRQHQPVRGRGYAMDEIVVTATRIQPGEIALGVTVNATFSIE